jgi:hypothetical protein
MKSIRVTSSNPVTLVAVNTAEHSVEATLVLPVGNLGTDYIHTGLSQPAGSNHCNGFILIAIDDNTTLDFSGSSHVFPSRTLSKGEVYFFFDQNVDPRGLRFKSTKKFAYFQSGTRSRIQAPEGDFRQNYTFEQKAPFQNWGTRFIMPTNNISPDHEIYAGFARIYPKEANYSNSPLNTNVTIYYSDGTNESEEIQSWQPYKDIKINADNKPNAKACYIVTDKPVSVCVHHVPRGYLHLIDESQPGEAWLPSLDQRITGVLISPLDISGNHVFIPMKHYFIIIAPTESRNNTTISINKGAAQLLSDLPSTTFKWIDTNVRNSGFAFGLYYFGESNVGHPSNPKYLNTTAYVENPDGIVVLAYGQGSYTNYYYSLGDAGRRLQPSFYVNDIHYQDIDGMSFCGITEFDFRLSTALTPAAGTYLRWFVNDVEQLSSPNATNNPNWTRSLPYGTHKITMIHKDIDNNIDTLITTFSVKEYTATATHIIGDDASICINSSIDLNTLVSVTSEISNPIFHWYYTETGFIELSSTVVTPAPPSQTYYVSVEGDNHCEGGANATGRKPITVFVNPPATLINITGPADTTVCSGYSVALRATSTGVTSPVYRWYSSPTATTPFYTGETFHTPTTLPEGNTIYYVSVLGSNFCEGDINARRAVTITVNKTVKQGLNIFGTVD